MASSGRHSSTRFLTNDGQCQNCSAFNFSEIFGVQADGFFIYPPYAIRNAIANEEICRTCALLVSAGRKIIGRPFIVTERRERQMEFVFERKWRPPVRDATGAVVSGGGALSVRIVPPPSPFEIDAVVEFYLCPMWLEEDMPWEHSLSTQFVLEDEIDLSLCQRWLRDCEGTHSTACREVINFRSELPEDFRVIDVQDYCVVPAPANCRYVALSYVWGQVETLCLTQENVLALECPQTLDLDSLSNAKTIMDAMMVVSRMGERYLWVDRLCIVQDSPNKQAQLRGMDVVYGAALLTLVAADGSDANAGLQGIAPGSRSLPQLKEVIDENFGLAVSCAPPADVSQSTWSSRGWTCQEQLLSRRFLIFADGQMLWQCGSCFLCEDTEAVNKSAPLTPLERVDIDTNLARPLAPISKSSEPSHLYRPKIFSKYGSIVSGFTKRHLTFKDDVLHAFQGFGSILQRSFNCDFIAGLPEAYLDQALLWLPAVQQERRMTSSRDCPSWSWAGWIGQACFEDNAGDQRERLVPIVKWNLLERDGSTRLANKTGAGIQDSRFGYRWTINTFLWIPLFEMLTGRFDEPATIHHQPDRGPYLQFWTSCAFFRISIRLRPPDQNAASRNPPLTALINAASSASGAYAGHLTLNGAEPVSLDPRRHEFVVVSEAQYAGFDVISSRYTPSDACAMYNVLLVEWDVKREVAYRLGVGRVLKQAWNQAKPVMKFVKLG